MEYCSICIHVNRLEKVQKYAVKLVPELRGYELQREANRIESKDSKTRVDMTYTRKLLGGIARVDKDMLLERSRNRYLGYIARS